LVSIDDIKGKKVRLGRLEPIADQNIASWNRVAL
jgi:hypothetical protein